MTGLNELEASVITLAELSFSKGQLNAFDLVQLEGVTFCSSLRVHTVILEKDVAEQYVSRALLIIDVLSSHRIGGTNEEDEEVEGSSPEREKQPGIFPETRRSPDRNSPCNTARSS